jgi:HEAT repeats
MMKILSKTILAGVFWTLTISAFTLQAAPTGSNEETKLIQDLSATNSDAIITDAMSELERRYHKDPSQTNAIPALKALLTDKRSPVRRKAARILGIFHAQLNDAEIKEVCAQLHASDWGEIQSGLKALRDLNTPQAVPDILPLLKYPNQFVVRDACRTLAVIADKSVISSIEPLLQNPNKAVVKDARKAINTLKNKQPLTH